jgi:hypothetical protein
MDETMSFEFKQCVSIHKSTGKKAGNLRELRDVIAEASEESIVHHNYQYFLKGHMLEYTNDFAEWVGEHLGEKALAEHLSNIDPYDFKEIGALRNELLGLLDDYLDGFPNPKEAMPGDELYFNETVTLIFPAGIKARNLAEFFAAIKYIEEDCIYYHFYDARIRLGRGSDDFSRWFEDTLGEKDLAGKIRAIDPLMYTVEQIRTIIAGLVEKAVRRDMEVIS